MSNIENGGPAFPTDWYPTDGKPFQGMTLRDYFAAQALPACIQFCERERWNWAADRAYEIADAMLKARQP